jgi:hypothetical protein
MQGHRAGAAALMMICCGLVNRLVRMLAGPAVGFGLLAALAAGLAPTVAAAGKPPRERKFLLGVEGMGLQVPALRPKIAALDSKYLGPTVTLGGIGVIGRWQVVPIVALELAVRTGSLRYHSRGDVISQDMVLAEAGALLYLLRNTIGHLAIDGGAGGLVHAIRYELHDRPRGSQRVGAALIHVGVDLEIRLRRIAFTASLRSYGVITDVARTAARGALFDGVPESQRRAPVAVLSTYLLGSVGIAYRF